ncbi:MAG: hypothetical protein ACLTEE_16170 [Anaerobutyricum hallii]
MLADKGVIRPEDTRAGCQMVNDHKGYRRTFSIDGKGASGGYSSLGALHYIGGLYL